MLTRLRDDITSAVDILADLGFRIAAAKVQIDIACVFVGELLDGGETALSPVADLAALSQSLWDGSHRTFSALTELDARLRTLLRGVAGVRAELAVLRALVVNGPVEAARLHDDDSPLTRLFASIGADVRDADGHLQTVLTQGRRAAGRDAATEGRVGALLAEADAAIEALQSASGP